jgi:hypothetical protein
MLGGKDNRRTLPHMSGPPFSLQVPPVHGLEGSYLLRLIMKIQNQETFSPRKKVIYSLGMIILTAFSALAVTETFLRIFLPQQEDMQWHLSDARYGFVMKKNFQQTYHYIGSDVSIEVKTNSMGLRGKEYDLGSPSQKRVLLLGDSFTFGYGVNVEANFASKLEELLNDNGNNWIVINAGHGGWGTLQESLYANDHFDLFKPDIIVLTFCGNDPSDDLLFSQKRHDSEKGILPFPGKVFIRQHSHLYRFIFRTYKVLSNRWTIEKKLADVSNREEVYIDEQSGSVITAEDWKITLGRINAFHHDFLKFNPNGILLIQASAPLDKNIRQHLISLSNGSNLFYVDLYDEIKPLQLEQMRLPYDGHWSPLLHSISAKKLFEMITISSSLP